jgi:hypothetical protein
MSVILRRSSVKIDEPYSKKTSDNVQLSLNASTPRDPESQEAQTDVQIHVFYKYSPTKLRFWMNPSTFHLFFRHYCIETISAKLILQKTYNAV